MACRLPYTGLPAAPDWVAGTDSGPPRGSPRGSALAVIAELGVGGLGILVLELQGDRIVSLVVALVLVYIIGVLVGWITKAAVFTPRR